MFVEPLVVVTDSCLLSPRNEVVVGYCFLPVRLSVRPFTQKVYLRFFACKALMMLELMQKGICNTFLVKLCHFDSHFTFQGLRLPFWSS